MENKNNLPWILLVIFLVGIVVYFAVESGNRSIQPTFEENSSLVEECDFDATQYYEARLKNQGNWESSYTNHFSKKYDKCYILARMDFDETFNTYIYYTLSEVNHINEYGNPEAVGHYSQTIDNSTSAKEIKECKVNEIKCENLSEFLELTEEYMRN